jgi:hypothetical protein
MLLGLVRPSRSFDAGMDARRRKSERKWVGIGLLGPPPARGSEETENEREKLARPEPGEFPRAD